MHWLPLTIGLGGAVALATACSSSGGPDSVLGDMKSIGRVDGATSPPIAPADGATAGSSSANDGSTDAASADREGQPSDATAADALQEAEARDGATSDEGPPGADSAPPPAARCNPVHTWGPGPPTALVPQAGFGRFGGIGANELAIAWTSTIAAIYVADRIARGSAFGAPSVIDTTATPVAMDRVALDPTGMLLVAVSTDHARFISFHRASVGGAWTPSVPLPFTQVDAMSSAEQGGQFSEPVLGADGNSFFYVLATPTALPALYESKWDAQQGGWTVGTPLANPELASASAATPSYATGASSDGRTLFFHDGATGRARAAWRDTATSPFVLFVDVPNVLEAAPNYECNALYVVRNDSAGAGVFIAQ